MNNRMATAGSFVLGTAMGAIAMIEAWGSPIPLLVAAVCMPGFVNAMALGLQSLDGRREALGVFFRAWIVATSFVLPAIAAFMSDAPALLRLCLPVLACAFTVRATLTAGGRIRHGERVSWPLSAPAKAAPRQAPAALPMAPAPDLALARLQAEGAARPRRLQVTEWNPASRA